MKWRFGFLILLFVLLFIGGPANDAGRLFRALWNTGHMVLFSALVIILLSQPVFEKQRWIVLFFMVSGFCLIVGFATEAMQLLVGRDFELNDVLNDCLGGYLGLLIFTMRQSQYRAVTGIFLYSLMLAIVVWVFRPVAYIVVDEYIMDRDFPVLADFETPYELSRWDNKLASLSFTEKFIHRGSKSMRVDFAAGPYPSVTLKNFPRNWRGFETINFSVFNIQNKDILMELKIYDDQHDRTGHRHDDRFNRELILKTGWNNFIISLDEVKLAPTSRDMDLADIAGVSLFLQHLKQPVTLYFDGLRLSSSH